MRIIETYRLYVGRLQDIPEGVQYSFYSSRRGYLFLFTDKEVHDGFVVLPPEKLDELSPEERAWFDTTVQTITLNWLKEHKPTEEEILDNLFEEVEERLKAMREMLIKGKENEREREDSGTGDHSEIS